MPEKSKGKPITIKEFVGDYISDEKIKNRISDLIIIIIAGMFVTFAFISATPEYSLIAIIFGIALAATLLFPSSYMKISAIFLFGFYLVLTFSVAVTISPSEIWYAMWLSSSFLRAATTLLLVFVLFSWALGLVNGAISEFEKGLEKQYEKRIAAYILFGFAVTTAIVETFFMVFSYGELNLLQGIVIGVIYASALLSLYILSWCVFFALGYLTRYGIRRLKAESVGKGKRFAVP